jgi:hypothetical protein
MDAPKRKATRRKFIDTTLGRGELAERRWLKKAGS